MWQQVYDPFGNSLMSTIAAAVPVVTLLVLIATSAVKTHLAGFCEREPDTGFASGKAENMIA
jgi:hypothetical protein